MSESDQVKNGSKIWLIVPVLIILIGGFVGGWYWFKFKSRTVQPQDSTTQSKEVSLTSSKGEVLKLDKALAGQKVSSPLEITGEARGTWYFEGSFPLVLQDANGKKIAEVPATAQGEWMTTDFVPFRATIVFSEPATNTGKLILKKDNPSDIRELDDQIEIPVKF